MSKPLKPTAKIFSMRVTTEFLHMIDTWRLAQTDQIAMPSRAAAIKCLIERGFAQRSAGESVKRARR